MRKQLKNMELEDLIERGTFDKKTADKIKSHVASGSSILIAGNTGTGKTTLINTLSDLIPKSEEIMIIQGNNSELNVTDDSNVSYVNESDILLKAEQLKPDRIIIDELIGSGPEGFIELLASGPRGITSVHSNSIENALERANLFLPNNMTDEEKNELVRKAFDLIIVAEMVSDGKRIIRKVFEVAELK